MFNIWESIIYCVKLLISQILGSLFLEIKHLASILFNLSQAFGPNIYRSLLAMMVMAERLEFPHPDDHTIQTSDTRWFKSFTVFKLCLHSSVCRPGLCCEIY